MVEQINDKDYQKKLELIQATTQLDFKEKEMKSSQGYVKAYLWSILIPPIGVYYFIKYVFFSGGSEDSIRAGIISLILTIVSLLLSIFLMIGILRQTTSGNSSQNLQMLKNLAVPDNQKKFIELFR